MKKLLFNLYFWPSFLFVTIIGLLILPGILVIQRIIFRRTLASSLRRSIRYYGWLLVCMVPFLNPVSVDDQSMGMPSPAIFTPNHSSSIDPYLFGALNIENCFVTSWPFKIPIYKYFMKLAGYINSNDGWEKVKRQGSERLEAGSSLTIWPEGHRSRNGRLLRFHNGAFKLAVETGYPIIPVCILGSDIILPPGKRLLNPGHVQMILLPPIYPPKNIDSNEAVSILKKKTKSMIGEKLADKRSLSPIPFQKVDQSSYTINKPSC